MKRIRYFHHGLWPSASPSTTFVTLNCLGFAEEGADFELVTVANSDREIPEVLAHDFGITQALRIHLLRAGSFRRSHKVVYLLAFVHFLMTPWDVLITRNLGFLPWALLLRLLRGGFVIFESHDFYSDPALRGIPDGPSARKQGRRERRWIPRVDGVVCVSEPWRQDYLQCYPSQQFITAVAGVRPPHIRRPKRSGPGTLVGYFGTFDPVLYDIDLMLTAIGLVTVPGCRLIMVGGRSEAELGDMRARAARCGVAERVDVLPWQSLRELETVKMQVDLGLAPLAINARNRGGSPLKVVEYLSAGIPVIGSDLPSIRDALGKDACGLIAENNPGSWAAAIMRVLSDPDLAASLSANCVARAEDLSWKRRAGRILNFVGGLTPRRQRAA